MLNGHRGARIGLAHQFGKASLLLSADHILLVRFPNSHKRVGEPDSYPPHSAGLKEGIKTFPNQETGIYDET